MKKITSISLLALAGLTAINAQAGLFNSKIDTIGKLGFGPTNLVASDNQKDAGSSIYIGSEYNYASWNSKPIYLGSGILMSSAKYSSIYGTVDLDLNLINIYTGLRIPFALNDDLYATVAGGIQFAIASASMTLKEGKFSEREGVTNLYGQAGIGYSISPRWSVEGTLLFYPSSTLLKSGKASTKGGSSSLVFSLGYSF